MLIGLALLLSGCGAVLPIMDLKYSSDERYAKFVRAIAEHVRCEMHKAVADEYDPNSPTRKVLYFWAAKIALTIRALDKGAVNPGILASNAPGPFTFAASGQFEADGTREMTMTYFLPFNELLGLRQQLDVAGRQLDCDGITATTEVTEPIAGNLGIDQSLQAALQAWDGFNTLAEGIKGGPFDTITHHVTFQIIAGGSATPTWKLVNVTAFTPGSLLSATRTTTNELLVTMGPTQLGTRKQIISPALDQSFFIERLKSAVRPQ